MDSSYFFWSIIMDIKCNSQRIKSLEKYYEDPSICLYCGKVIEVKPHQKIYDVKIKKFCSMTCRNKYCNPQRRQKTSKCKTCGKTYERYFVNGRWSLAKNCPDCQSMGYGNSISFMGKTKKDIYDTYSSKYSARNAIAQNAQVVYRNKNGDNVCFLCGYEKHIETCHIKPVSDFDDLAFISEINTIHNLIALCPNCHWEFDNNALDESDLQKIKDHQSGKI